jgi:hypothetical protein
MIPLYAAGTMVVGMVVGTRLGPRVVVKVAAWTALVISGAGAFLWESEPFARAVRVLGFYYAVLACALLYTAFGVLLGLLYRKATAGTTARSR